MGPLRGSLTGRSITNGRRQALSYGRMGIVWFTLFLPPLSLMASGFVAGSGKTILWWVTPQLTCVDVGS